MTTDQEVILAARRNAEMCWATLWGQKSEKASEALLSGPDILVPRSSRWALLALAAVAGFNLGKSLTARWSNR